MLAPANSPTSRWELKEAGVLPPDAHLALPGVALVTPPKHQPEVLESCRFSLDLQGLGDGVRPLALA